MCDIDLLIDDLELGIRYALVRELPEKGDKDTIYIYRGSDWIYLDCWTELRLSDPEEQRTKCPNCGAPLTNGHCNYCGCY